MLPDSHNLPTCSPQTLGRILVAPLVRIDFLAPEGCISLRPRPMPGTTVPETTIDEYGKTIFWEGYVDGSAHSGQQSPMCDVSISFFVQQRSDSSLEWVVASASSLHPVASCLRRRPHSGHAMYRSSFLCQRSFSTWERWCLISLMNVLSTFNVLSVIRERNPDVALAERGCKG